jgi:hypothetical protein
MDRYDAMTTMAKARLILEPACTTGEGVLSTAEIIASHLLPVINLMAYLLAQVTESNRTLTVTICRWSERENGLTLGTRIKICTQEKKNEITTCLP